ncbi:MAG: hypothetical protein ACD_72C00540G0002 [uncultured bacterium]|nr:MAG: hypothetical protein ACD_72C00540G0002 [uncultured bacterium]
MSLKNILSLLSDPDSGQDLIITNNTLTTANGEHVYNIDGDVPLLFSTHTDREHLAEEEKLAEMMKRTPSSPHDAFSLQQWAQSKKEFWAKTKQLINSRPSGQNIINIGCGYDDHADEFATSGHTFINFDLVKTMLLDNKNHSQNGGYYVAGDINYLPFKKQSFDVVISIDIIHHEYARLPEILKKLTDLLKPGGLLLLEDPNAWAIFQIPKTLLPQSIHTAARKLYHRLKKSTHQPADYEFPTSPFYVKNILKDLGMKDVVFHSHDAYPGAPKFFYLIYKTLRFLPFIAKFGNYHYFLSATKK